jgi:acyl-CoA hydrolase/GNAT superfamily N-acetyltransferase
MPARYWPDEYLKKRCSPDQAMRKLRPGQRVFVSTSCGEPQALVRSLDAACSSVSDLEIIRLMSLESLPLGLRASETDCESLSIRSFYLGSTADETLDLAKRFIVPINLSNIPRLFLSRRLPVNVALVQVSPPDDFGWMSLGISVDVTLAAVQSAEVVIAQINPRMPRVLGRSFIHVNDVNLVVEQEEELLTAVEPRETEADALLGRQAAQLIDDGATIQLSLAASPRAVMGALAGKNDLGVHTQFLSDGLMHLVSRGVVTNRKKEINQGQCVASGAVGSANLYEFLDDNPGISFFPSDYVNNPAVIAQHSRMVSVNTALFMDLSGQAAVDALPVRHFTGVTGTMDFVRGARMAARGKSIILMHSTAGEGRSSRIVPSMGAMPVVIPRADVHYVATEYGVANLFGKTLEERALALINIAHPDFRDALLETARRTGIIHPSRSLQRSIHSVYPFRLEEAKRIHGEEILFRPVKSVDSRLVQEHFYHLDSRDVRNRFLHPRSSFGRRNISALLEIDYVQDLTIVAVTGEVGFEQVIAMGGYYSDPETNTAEVAFSVLPEWQGRGISSIIQLKLAQAARENGMLGLTAYVSPENEGMIRLFKKLPYRVTTSVEGGVLLMRAKFDEPLER